MSRTYSQLIDLVRNWSNRDSEVLSNAIVADCLRYAADKAYRTLRIPPMEHTVRYTAAQLQANTVASNNLVGSYTELCIPDDLIEFMYIRSIDSAGRTTRMFNEKADLRTFLDLYAEKKNDFAYWARHGNNILVAAGFGNAGSSYGSTGVGYEEQMELHYYRRLPALYARYDATIANARLGLLTEVTEMNTLPTGTTGTPDVAPPTVRLIRTETGGVVTFTQVADQMDTTMGSLWYGNYVPNWLRDENERILLMGALAEVFFYLQENEESQKYAALFMQEIEELNREDKMRHGSGGNVQVNYNGRGLI